MGTAAQNPVVCSGDFTRSVKVTITNGASSTQVEIDLGHTGNYRLERVAQTRSGGTGATHQPFLTHQSGDTNVSAPAYGRIFTEAATPVATQINDVLVHAVGFHTTNGKVYFNPGFDAGADNNCIAELFFEVCGGSQQLKTN